MSGTDGALSRVARALIEPPDFRIASLEAAMQRLVSDYGAKDVRDAALRLTKQKRGRKAEKDWPLLQDQMKSDARQILSGADPADLPSNYAIASDFTLKHPGHNPASTQRRIMGKLAKGRGWITYYYVVNIAEKEAPFATYFRAVQSTPSDNRFRRFYVSDADRRRGVLERYRERFGEPPAEMTIAAIEAEMAKPTHQELKVMLPAGGLFGLAGRSRINDDENRGN